MELPPPLEEVDSPKAPKASPLALAESKSAGWLPTIRPLSGVSALRSHAQTMYFSTPKQGMTTPSPAGTEGWVFTDGWGGTPSRLQASSLKPDMASTGPALLRKSKSDSALHGLSPKASSENVRAGGTMFGLTRAHRSGAVVAGRTEFVDQGKLVKDIDKLTTALGEVKTMFEGFDPRRSPKKKPTFSDLLAGGKAQKEGAEGDADNDGDEALREAQERLAERLQAYKFCRRIEPELPPLAPLASSGLAPRKPSQTLVVRNTTPEAIRIWLPANRKERIAAFAEERSYRRRLYQTQRERMVEEAADSLKEELVRKEEQAKQTVESRKLQAKLKSESRDFPAAKWFTLIWAAGFLRQIQQDQKQRKVPVLERVEYLRENSDNLLVKRSRLTAGQMKEALRMETVVQSPAVSRLFTSYVASMKMKRNITKAKANAKKVYQALRSWQVAGRVIFALKNVAFQARKIQRFWRACSARLREQREKVAQRWEKLERHELTQELSKWERPAGQRNSNACLTLEDKIAMELTPKAVRLTFVENELRARRYFLLPAIANWEQECIRWNEEYAARLETKRAYQALGQEEGFMEKPEHAFSFPPSRPMHLPPAHPLGEAARGAICSLGCPGRKGDEEILDMWRRCRQDPTGWKKVPRTGMKDFVIKKTKTDRSQAEEKILSLDELLENDKAALFVTRSAHAQSTFAEDKDFGEVASRRQRANHAQFRFPAEAMCYDCDGVSYTDGQSKISLTVYTPEQQARLGLHSNLPESSCLLHGAGVDESGKPKAAAPVAAPVGVPKVGAIGPAWTRGEIEKPAGTKDMGGWTAGMGMFLDDEDIKAAVELTKDFAGGDKDSLSEEEFARWFRELLKESVTGRIQKVARTPPALLSVTVKSMAGTEKVVEVPRDSDVSTLAEAAAAAMDLPYAQTRISVNGQVLPDRTLLSSLELELSSDPEVIAVVMNKLKVRRHVYKARGGAPPHRGYHLVATDEIDLAPNAKISEQLEVLVPPDGISRRTPDNYKLKAFQASPNEQAPRKWEGGMNEVEPDLSLTAEELFGTLQNVDLAVMVPMEGFD
ncbi:unnamed protein product [Symbiodinium microadriaticum]|nr:unnamed protein product [Symbiodinium microadriaticum]